MQRTVGTTYAALTWSVAAVSGAVAITSGVLLGSPDPLAAGVGVAAIIVTALRTRAFPLAAQAAVLWAALLVGVVIGLIGQTRFAPPGAVSVVALAAVVMVLSSVRPPAPTRAALRKTGDVLEVIAVVALLPLVVGLFGVYADLVGSFR